MGDDDSGAAGGAGGARAEPGVDACDVEGVAAAGEHAQRVAVGELVEADGAVGGGGSGEWRGGQRVDGLLLQALLCLPLVWERIAAAADDAATGSGGGAPAAAAGAAGDEGETEHTDKRAEE